VESLKFAGMFFKGGRTTSGCTLACFSRQNPYTVLLFFCTEIEETIQQHLWQLACFSRQDVQQHLRLNFGTKIKEDVQQLLLFCFAICKFFQVVVRHEKRDKL